MTHLLATDDCETFSSLMPCIISGRAPSAENPNSVATKFEGTRFDLALIAKPGLNIHLLFLASRSG